MEPDSFTDRIFAYSFKQTAANKFKRSYKKGHDLAADACQTDQFASLMKAEYDNLQLFSQKASYDVPSAAAHAAGFMYGVIDSCLQVVVSDDQITDLFLSCLLRLIRIRFADDSGIHASLRKRLLSQKPHSLSVAQKTRFNKLIHAI